MTLQEALRLLDIVTDVNEQYSKQERIRADLAQIRAILEK